MYTARTYDQTKKALRQLNSRLLQKGKKLTPFQMRLVYCLPHKIEREFFFLLCKDREHIKYQYVYGHPNRKKHRYDGFGCVSVCFKLIGNGVDFNIKEKKGHTVYKNERIQKDDWPHRLPYSFEDAKEDYLKFCTKLFKEQREADCIKDLTGKNLTNEQYVKEYLNYTDISVCNARLQSDPFFKPTPENIERFLKSTLRDPLYSFGKQTGSSSLHNIYYYEINSVDLNAPQELSSLSCFSGCKQSDFAKIEEDIRRQVKTMTEHDFEYLIRKGLLKDIPPEIEIVEFAHLFLEDEKVQKDKENAMCFVKVNFKLNVSAEEIKDFLRDHYYESDPTEDSPEYKAIKRELEIQIDIREQRASKLEKQLNALEQQAKGIPAYDIFERDWIKKRILREKYNIDWLTPIELNPFMFNRHIDRFQLFLV